MGLQDREWFNEARKAPKKPKKPIQHSKQPRSLKAPSWAIVGVAVTIAIAVILWL
ncbi:hypothetical protein M8R19_33055 [Pseudomonas sp. R3.Fl]|uniref:hypothetical protein n=1 Tax=Pseudomonas sp. R3.Fl TaxID=2928708 RepID=UPI00201DF5F0|nr:hypothetical protein [Pseudomonas sp. R3.Fl]MCL6687092.1 hypothetical protein [Pseudomonas sp. R3.Fl]MCL6687103.1 hypothetical protein [Pseudomonas sp. R3.Fl]MCL6687114.1 hypothetical protein [Pseudomonas sp. R3.Fl]MCL6687125.1 hypothetical protein [Pseudomonas sp. R3.Fl]MCL6693499.1 hypothetical protein [Pseudomonas sp. R3.Fl]